MGRKKFNMDPKKVKLIVRNNHTVTVELHLYDLNELLKYLQNKKVPEVKVCTFLFKQGIQFLLENDLLQNTPEDIAQFLYKGEGLNKTVIGDYLGER